MAAMSEAGFPTAERLVADATVKLEAARPWLTVANAAPNSLLDALIRFITYLPRPQRRDILERAAPAGPGASFLDLSDEAEN